MSDLIIELFGEQFRRAYLLYIIEIQHNNERHYYIGQTGDRHYKTARPAFRRLLGHLEDSEKSTQNQIYKYIVSKVSNYSKSIEFGGYTEECKQAVEDYLVDSSLRMHVYRVLPFNPTTSQSNHLENVRKISLLEKYVIAAFIRSGRSIINRAIYSSFKECPFPQLLNRIKAEFSL